MLSLHPNKRTTGTFTNFDSLDDKIDGQHYYTMFIKFGQGRAMNDACRDIRDGFISRDEALLLMKKYDGEFPKKDLDEVLEFLDLRKSEFLDIINKHRNEEIWYKNNKKSWHLYDAIYF